jgi:hypothetical protein
MCSQQPGLLSKGSLGCFSKANLDHKLLLFS